MISLIWGGVVLVIAGLVKHEFHAHRKAYKADIKAELDVLGSRISDCYEYARQASQSATTVATRVQNLEKRVVGTELGTKLGRM